MCSIGDGATEILTSFPASGPCLKSLSFYHNNLPPATLASLIDYLNGTGGCLEELSLSGNGSLFGTSNVGLHGRFFDAIANHMAIRHLDVQGCGRVAIDGSFSWAVFKNRSLVTMNGEKAEYIRRNILMALIQSTMRSPVNIRFAIWPMALGVCAPRIHQVGARPMFCLIQKMAEGDVFVHAAAVYRFEKIRASIRVQRWWRRGR